MTTALAAPAGCCPESIGQVCWDDGTNSGTAFAVYLPDSDSTRFFDSITGDAVLGEHVIPCPLPTEQTTYGTVASDSTFNIPGGGSSLLSWSVLAITGTPSINVNTGGAIAMTEGERAASSVSTSGHVLNDTVQIITGAGQVARVAYTTLA